jgi:hypothetical protein
MRWSIHWGRKIRLGRGQLLGCAWSRQGSSSQLGRWPASGQRGSTDRQDIHRSPWDWCRPFDNNSRQDKNLLASKLKKIRNQHGKTNDDSTTGTCSCDLIDDGDAVSMNLVTDE